MVKPDIYVQACMSEKKYRVWCKFENWTKKSVEKLNFFKFLDHKIRNISFFQQIFFRILFFYKIVIFLSFKKTALKRIEICSKNE